MIGSHEIAYLKDCQKYATQAAASWLRVPSLKKGE
jgi:hypothetical protein